MIVVRKKLQIGFPIKNGAVLFFIQTIFLKMHREIIIPEGVSYSLIKKDHALVKRDSQWICSGGQSKTEQNFGHVEGEELSCLFASFWNNNTKTNFSSE